MCNLARHSQVPRIGGEVTGVSANNLNTDPGSLLGSRGKAYLDVKLKCGLGIASEAKRPSTYRLQRSWIFQVV